MQTPSNITLNKDKNILTLTFEGVDYPLNSEFLRVYSPSAEVVGHGPGQEILQLDKQNVKIDRIEPTGNYAIYLSFSDGHDTGIYSWEHLHKLAVDKDALWSTYLKRLKAAGHSHPEL
ncbi:gamma-butyrobetaine hydroxylase-like domain-containing protein [Candidatus Thioglobus sp.]|uniref:gamma-butyrobetaine hydroxylase-like domain-containing protein n=1 Tax=Candidatus Thioglobus sp. TaxID=2026721 RepID=UPI003D122DB0